MTSSTYSKHPCKRRYTPKIPSKVYSTCILSLKMALGELPNTVSDIRKDLQRLSDDHQRLNKDHLCLDDDHQRLVAENCTINNNTNCTIHNTGDKTGVVVQFDVNTEGITHAIDNQLTQPPRRSIQFNMEGNGRYTPYPLAVTVASARSIRPSESPKRYLINSDASL
ncbi:hypothetical protein BC938DRAFT_471095 [Jimgerdemannia flammicorona]|uniref:Uncharacterized protein n=1 Tax=Jimgerdemannia flammicorona TaxID=994334 RepID=A0A433QUU0_9FUNG|nr:hypothetical protein BC938DRAFT_471095 [Jimgerdemannia flammicorona]